SGAYVADVVPAPLLVQANSLQQFVRPLAMTLIGPALGGLLVGSVGSGSAFAFDALSYAAGVAALLAVRSRRLEREAAGPMLAELRDGLAFVRRQTWIWAT